jgi:pheromone shutdown protein TraB
MQKLFLKARSSLSYAASWQSARHFSQQQSLQQENTAWPSDQLYHVLHNEKNGSKVHLVGTNHTSPHSSDDVRRVARLIKPDAVALELCEQRAPILLTNKPTYQKMFFENTDVTRLEANFDNIVFDQMQTVLAFVSGSAPAAEFFTGMIEAEKVSANVYLIDQKMDQITVPSLYEENDVESNMIYTLFSKPHRESMKKSVVSTFQNLFRGSREEALDDDNNDVKHMEYYAELADYMNYVDDKHVKTGQPYSDTDILECKKLNDNFQEDVMDAGLQETTEDEDEDGFIEDRDTLMAHALWNLPGKTIMAVVGAKHVHGIMKKFGHTTTEEFLALGGSEKTPQYDYTSKHHHDLMLKNNVKAGLTVRLLKDPEADFTESMYTSDSNPDQLAEYHRMQRHMLQFTHHDWEKGLIEGYEVSMHESLLSDQDIEFGRTMQNVQAKQHAAADLILKIKELIDNSETRLLYISAKSLADALSKMIKTLRKHSKGMQNLLKLKIRVEHPVLRFQLSFQNQQLRKQKVLATEFAKERAAMRVLVNQKRKMKFERETASGQAKLKAKLNDDVVAVAGNNNKKKINRNKKKKRKKRK